MDGGAEWDAHAGKRVLTAGKSEGRHPGSITPWTVFRIPPRTAHPGSIAAKPGTQRLATIQRACGRAWRRCAGARRFGVKSFVKSFKGIVTLSALISIW